ncbi:hypothetical protein DFJ74DRAFT_705221 [Hyaloraphidium curvatum]|nr:hypothetical protein DFJ74DRAFT_705221 [Hyaloraphidium curvatum]
MADRDAEFFDDGAPPKATDTTRTLVADLAEEVNEYERDAWTVLGNYFAIRRLAEKIGRLVGTKERPVRAGRESVEAADAAGSRIGVLSAAIVAAFRKGGREEGIARFLNEAVDVCKGVGSAKDLAKHAEEAYERCKELYRGRSAEERHEKTKDFKAMYVNSWRQKDDAERAEARHLASLLERLRELTSPAAVDAAVLRHAFSFDDRIPPPPSRPAGAGAAQAAQLVQLAQPTAPAPAQQPQPQRTGGMDELD